MFNLENLFENLFNYLVKVKQVGKAVDLKFEMPPTDAGFLCGLFAARSVTDLEFDAQLLAPIQRIVVGRKFTTIRVVMSSEAEAKRLTEGIEAGIIRKMKPSRVQ